MGPKKKNKGQSNNKRGFFKEIRVGEDVRMAVQLKLQDFRNSEEEKEYEFPSSLSADERCYIHRLAQEMGIKTKSRGKGATRYLTVFKQEGSTIMQSDAALGLSPSSKKFVLNLLTQFPVTNKERQELLPPTDRDRSPYLLNEVRDMSRSMGKLNSGIPQVPPPAATLPEILKLRKELPIWAQRNEIIQGINQNQVTLITGETGSGKTTQVPQFILEHFNEQRQPCRIVCTEPRRLAAVTVAERVAYERDEKVGQSVGFQIRLESRVSPKTLLTYCTNGVLLRTLMGAGDVVLSTLSHIIIDEIHERDKFSDFLLTVLREAMHKFRGLKIILMSATVDVSLFLNYFTGAKHIFVPGRMFPVKEIYLEDILVGLNYMNPEMKKLQKTSTGNFSHASFSNRSEMLAQITQTLSSSSGNPDNDKGEERASTKETSNEAELKAFHEEADVVLEQEFEGEEEDQNAVAREDLDEAMEAKLDETIANAFLKGDLEHFDQLVNLVLNGDNRTLDYQHSVTGVTALMAAACRDQIAVLEQLLESGADLDLRAKNNWTARDFALGQNLPNVVDILETFKQTLEPVSYDFYDAVIEDELSRDITEEQRFLLGLYHNSVTDEKVDLDLTSEVIHYLSRDSSASALVEDGGILVFLPGYDDIVSLYDKLSNSKDLLVLTLHSQMSSIDQKKIFRPAPPGMKKVILSTNIAETSITIDDIVCVIDAGKVKEKCFDSLTNMSMLKMVWISQTSSAQRKGRAGRCRPGLVYRLYSRARFENFAKFQTPEILRTPLMELCLHTKSLAPPNTPIADFLARVPQPPSFMVTRNAVQMLKTIEALDSWEDVTELGSHLLDLPVEPRLGKMVLYAVVLKCLDPILTIVCCSAYRDPFMLPINSELKKKAANAKQKFAHDSFSDHMALLRAFQAWQKSRQDGNERSFCYHHQISGSTMDMVTGMRTQLLGQLRASGFVRAKGPGDIRDLNKNSENWAVVKAAITAGIYPNLARFDRQAGQLRSMRESKVRLHPSCTILNSGRNRNGSTSQKNKESMNKLPTDWLIFDEMTRAGRLAMIRGVTAVSPFTVLIFAGPNRLPVETVSAADAGVQGNRYLEETSDSEVEEKVEGENTTLRIDEWTVFRSDADLAHLALQLRQKWSSLFLRRLHSPGKPPSQVDNTVVDTIVNILSVEEQTLGLKQPPGIGQRPKPISSEAVCSSSVSNEGSTNRSQPSPMSMAPSSSSNAGGIPGTFSRIRGGGSSAATMNQQFRGSEQQFFQRNPYR